ncbi:2TM domain-containing protein [Ferruginibacter yonginensis]|uniref:2TM domain-containing protein n=1 Tax=Ferruginibacter yonginensis TaxID=1310416 RepID=A0ABV8QQS5_9BACT
MNNLQQPINEKDEALWRLAKKRIKFKRSVLSYIIVNAFLWALWFYGNESDTPMRGSFNWPWPLWVSIGWGIGLAFQFSEAYMFPKSNAIEKEYEKLKNNSNNI